MKMILTIFLFTLFGCKDYDFNISKLKKEDLNFNSLPIEIKQYLLNPPDYRNDIKKMLVVLPNSEMNNYRLETVKTIVGPWVDYEKLLDVKKKISYRISQGIPSPYIIYKAHLYTPNRYNIYTVGDMEDVIFTSYTLR